MADVQIAVIDQQDTQIALAVPGVQGATGPGVAAGGSTNEVLFKQSGTDYDTAWGEITSAMIGDLEITNADVSASAAIAGTKISPNFGSQTIATTGSITAGANAAPVILTDTTGVTGADQVTNIISLTQAEYDAIVSPSASTFYVITA